ncbi:ABRA C-terminal like [Phyllostomus discolor]|uniref:Costars family protein ABRACL n=2 Tax=Phyllostomus discolor TaxID=89673 RepID=A0A834AN39_9CHIR|nr:ABRA C-terminal like [Phyllostomus discolor]
MKRVVAKLVLWFLLLEQKEHQAVVANDLIQTITDELDFLRKPRANAAALFRRKRKGGGETAMNVDHEVNLLVEEIHRLGSKNADGKLSVKFGVLFRDDRCANLFEALVGTLKAAKRRKIVTYAGELLLQGVHDDVDIILLQD